MLLGAFLDLGVPVEILNEAWRVSVTSPPLLSFKHFDVSGIPEMWKCRLSLCFLER